MNQRTVPVCKRDDIHIIGRNSSLSLFHVDRALKDNVYRDAYSWQKFIRYFFISLGICFTISGIIFFFAFNWQNIHSFIKLAIMQSLLILCIISALCLRVNLKIRNILLTGASGLAGGLFALYGQVYQTGADAYDLFLMWTVFITAWVIVSRFAPLWLIYLTLINLTIVVFSLQALRDFDTAALLMVLFIFNTAVLLISLKFTGMPSWFNKTIALASVFCSTLGMVICILEDNPFLIVFAVLMLSAYIPGLLYGYRNGIIFYISIIPFSLIIIITFILLQISSGDIMLITVSLFIILSTTLIIMKTAYIHRKKNEKL